MKFANIFWTKLNNKIIPFVPLMKVYELETGKWKWIGFRIDKSDNPRDFLIDICKSIDKRYLNLYKNYLCNDILIEVDENNVANTYEKLEQKEV